MGNGLLPLIFMLMITAIIFVATNLKIIKEIHDSPSISSILTGMLFWYAIPYLILYFSPALIGSFAQLVIKKLRHEGEKESRIRKKQ